MVGRDTAGYLGVRPSDTQIKKKNKYGVEPTIRSIQFRGDIRRAHLE